MCKYCDLYFGKTTESKCFKVNSNVEGMAVASIEKGNKSAEIILSTKKWCIWNRN